MKFPHVEEADRLKLLAEVKNTDVRDYIPRIVAENPVVATVIGNTIAMISVSAAERVALAGILVYRLLEIAADRENNNVP